MDADVTDNKTQVQKAFCGGGCADVEAERDAAFERIVDEYIQLWGDGKKRGKQILRDVEWYQGDAAKGIYDALNDFVGRYCAEEDSGKAIERVLGDVFKAVTGEDSENDRGRFFAFRDYMVAIDYDFGRCSGVGCSQEVSPS